MQGYLSGSGGPIQSQPLGPGERLLPCRSSAIQVFVNTRSASRCVPRCAVSASLTWAHFALNCGGNFLCRFVWCNQLKATAQQLDSQLRWCCFLDSWPGASSCAGGCLLDSWAARVAVQSWFLRQCSSASRCVPRRAVCRSGMELALPLPSLGSSGTSRREISMLVRAQS